jgi:hypothetical protein
MGPQESRSAGAVEEAVGGEMYDSHINSLKIRAEDRHLEALGEGVLTKLTDEADGGKKNLAFRGDLVENHPHWFSQERQEYPS